MKTSISILLTFGALYTLSAMAAHQPFIAKEQTVHRGWNSYYYCYGNDEWLKEELFDFDRFAAQVPCAVGSYPHLEDLNIERDFEFHDAGSLCTMTLKAHFACHYGWRP